MIKLAGAIYSNRFRRRRTQGVRHTRVADRKQSNWFLCLQIRLPSPDSSVFNASWNLGSKAVNTTVYTLHFESTPSGRPPLWNVALSITITCPLTSVGTKLVSSQISKTVRLQPPTTVKGSLSFWLHRAFAIVLIGPSRRPDLSAWKRCLVHSLA